MNETFAKAFQSPGTQTCVSYFTRSTKISTEKHARLNCNGNYASVSPLSIPRRMIYASFSRPHSFGRRGKRESGSTVRSLPDGRRRLLTDFAGALLADEAVEESLQSAHAVCCSAWVRATPTLEALSVIRAACQDRRHSRP